MKEKNIRVGDRVVVLKYEGTPLYTGKVIGVSKNAVLIQRDGFFWEKKLENKHYVEVLDVDTEVIDLK